MCCMKYFTKSCLYYQQGNKSLSPLFTFLLQIFCFQMIHLRNYFISSAAGAVCRVAVVKNLHGTRNLLSLLMYSNVMLQPLYIGVERFRILGGKV